MFYDKNLMNGEMLGSVWKLANNMAAKNVEECNLPRICTELDSWVSSDAGQARRRLSLRASSNLIGGAAKLYKCEMHKLFYDISKLDEDITRRRRRRHSNSPIPAELDAAVHLLSKREEGTPENSSSESVVSPEQMRRQTDAGFGTSITPPKRCRLESVSLEKMTKNVTMSRSTNSFNKRRLSSNKGDDTNRCSSGNCDTSSESFGPLSSRNSDGEHMAASGNTKQKQRKDQGVQTSPILNRRENVNSKFQDGFDTNLPFGYILIHDTYNSRIPTKIVFTSINTDARKLM